MKIHVSYKCKYCDAIFYSQHHMDQHVSDKHVAEHIPPINSNSSLSDLLLEDNEKSSKNTSKVPVSTRSFAVIVVKLIFRMHRLFLMLSRKSLKLNPNSKSEDRKASVEIQESLFVKCVYVRLVLQQLLQHTWRHMVVRKLSNVDFVKSHIYLQLIQKLIRIVVRIYSSGYWVTVFRLIVQPVPVGKNHTKSVWKQLVNDYSVTIVLKL